MSRETKVFCILNFCGLMFSKMNNMPCVSSRELRPISPFANVRGVFAISMSIEAKMVPSDRTNSSSPSFRIVVVASIGDGSKPLKLQAKDSSTPKHNEAIGIIIFIQSFLDL